MSELKSCPFCGSTDVRLIGEPARFKPVYACYCKGCGTQGGWRDSKDKAVDAWNRRAGESIDAGFRQMELWGQEREV